MRVKMLQTFAGPGGVWPAGSEQDFPADKAKRMIEGGHASPVRSVEVERATAPEAEQAVTQPTPKRRKRAVKKKAK